MGLMRSAATSLTMKAALVLSWISVGFLGTPAAAQGARQGGEAGGVVQPKAVLELFTSQGCSSCPPADALLKSYVARPDVLALSMPVDYWDYLGWKDTLANAKFSHRQKAYSKFRGDGRVYTPQIVVNGRMHVNGGSAAEIDRAIADEGAKLEKSRVATEIRSENGQLVISIGAAADGSPYKEANVWLACVQREAEVPVRAGENRGRTLVYYNVVREITPIGMWSGAAQTMRIDKDTVAQPGADLYAVLIQHGKGGPLIGAGVTRP